MSEQAREFLKVVKMLSDNGFLDHVVLIGSWAEYLYQNVGLLPKGTTALRTLDIDFLIKNLRKPQPPMDLEDVAFKEGFAIDKHPLLGTTKIRTASRLEIEFLIDQKGAGLEHVYRTALGVTAQALRGLDLLLKETVSVEYMGLEITVPIPESYVIHKILINTDRKKTGKKEKDIQSILAIFPYLNKEKYQELVESRTKKQQKIIDSFWASYSLPTIK